MYDSFNFSACACILNLEDWGVKLFAYAWSLFLGCYVAACVEEWGIQKNSQHIGRNGWIAWLVECDAVTVRTKAAPVAMIISTGSERSSSSSTGCSSATTRPA